MIVQLLAGFVAMNAEARFTFHNHKGRLRNTELAWNLNETFFPPLLYEVTKNPPLTEVPPATYPWLARVIPSQHLDHPTICTAACVRKRVFVTAARCVIGLTVGYASVVYKEQILEILTIVVPDTEDTSKQHFDDVGLLVTKPSKSRHPVDWETVDLFDVNRTDSEFQWFAKLGYEDGPIKHKMLAFYDSIENKELTRKLLELPVVVGIKFCQKIYSRKGELNGYFVPCALGCTYQQFLEYDKHENCKKQIAIEGAAVFNTETKQLLSVSTWVGKEVRQGQATKLPVGIAVVNSRNFQSDLVCALKIRDYVGHVYDGFYQKLCDGHVDRHSDTSSDEGRTSRPNTTLSGNHSKIERSHFIY